MMMIMKVMILAMVLVMTLVDDVGNEEGDLDSNDGCGDAYVNTGDDTDDHEDVAEAKQNPDN